MCRVVKSQYSAKELADMQLSVLPKTKANVIALAEREGWPYVDVTGRGGKRREYTPSAEVMGAIKAKVVNDLLPAVTTPTVAQNLLPVAHTGADLGLSTHQANVEGARRMVLDAIDRINREAGVSREAAMTTMLTQARCGVLNPMLEAALRLSRDGRGSKNGIKSDPYPSIRTIKGWRKDQLEGNSLAPAGGLNALNIPAWASEFLKYYQQPQKPSVADAYDDFLDSDWAEAQLSAGEKLPSMDSAVDMAGKLDVCVEWLLTGRGRKRPNDGDLLDISSLPEAAKANLKAFVNSLANQLATSSTTSDSNF